jgi:hypothetical protein
LLANQMIDIAYDGANFQVLSGVSDGAVMMTTPLHLYVSNTIGSDTLYDGTSATIGGTSGPFKTIQKALATMKKYNLGGQTFYIHLADGSYSNPTAILFPQPNGSGDVQLLGNTTNPAACAINNSGTGSACILHEGGRYFIDGVNIATTASVSGDGGHGLWTLNGSYVLLGRIRYGNVAGNHISCGAASNVRPMDEQIIAGSAFSHQEVYTNGVLMNQTPTNPSLTITTTVSLQYFVQASGGGQIWPVWGTITGAANAVGSKYRATGNGVIDSQGRGASYLPGTLAGATATGGQYL